MHLRHAAAITTAGLLFFGALGCGSGEKPVVRLPGRAAPTGTTPAESGPKPAQTTPAAVAKHPARKPVGELKVPAGLAEPPNEVKMLASVWPHMADLRAGDWTEYEQGSDMGVLRSRREIFDVADHAVVEISDTVAKFEGVPEQKTHTVVKMLYTEPDPPEQKVTAKTTEKDDTRVETKSTNRTFPVGNKTVTADTVTSSFKAEKLQARMWFSKQVPLGGLVLMEDGEGKAVNRLVGFDRGK